jgi:BirA family biotin operon repressor/biotin-[acetyl-CoA-carboxylase] ligase
MLDLPPDLAQALAGAASRIAPFGARAVFLAETGSTNDDGARLASLGAPDGTLVVAEAQTAGRGRLGRPWFSPPGAGLYVSIVMRPRPWHEPAGSSHLATGWAAPLLTLAGGVALAEGLRTATGLDVELRWPNDLMAPGGRRKLGGILTEASATGGAVEYIIFGFGLNLRAPLDPARGRAAFPPELADRATAIETELGRAVDRGAVLAECLAALAARRRDLDGGRAADVRARWGALAASSRGRPVEWTADNGPRRGVVEGIDETGALLVRVSHALERIVAGEVRWL